MSFIWLRKPLLNNFFLEYYIASGVVVALARACHNFDRGLMTVSFFWIFSSAVSKVHTDVWLFSFRRWDKFVQLSNPCNIRGNTVFGQNWLLQISSLLALIKVWVGIFCYVIGWNPFKLVVLIWNGKSFQRLLIFSHFLWFITFFTLPGKASCLFPAFSFLFTLTLFVATWARRRRTTTRKCKKLISFFSSSASCYLFYELFYALYSRCLFLVY